MQGPLEPHTQTPRPTLSTSPTVLCSWPGPSCPSRGRFCFGVSIPPVLSAASELLGAVRSVLVAFLARDEILRLHEVPSGDLASRVLLSPGFLVWRLLPHKIMTGCKHWYCDTVFCTKGKVSLWFNGHKMLAQLPFSTCKIF